MDKLIGVNVGFDRIRRITGYLVGSTGGAGQSKAWVGGKMMKRVVKKNGIWYCLKKKHEQYLPCANRLAALLGCHTTSPSKILAHSYYTPYYGDFFEKAFKEGRT